MRPLTCQANRRRLQAFHDQELPIEDQIAVAAHLDWCDRCAADLAAMRRTARGVRGVAASRVAAFDSDEFASLQASVLSQLKAEREVGVLARIEGMFDDWHLVYAALGATAAALACVVLTIGILRFATIERPDSLAAIVNMLAAPGSNGNPFAIDARVQLPRSLDNAFTTSGQNEEDAVFTLAAVVTREGRIQNLSVLHAKGEPASADQAKLVEGLLNAVSRARFEPARFGESPVAVNMVWMVAHTTVRASKHVGGLPPLRPGKRRVASVFASVGADVTGN